MANVIQNGKIKITPLGNVWVSLGLLPRNSQSLDKVLLDSQFSELYKYRTKLPFGQILGRQFPNRWKPWDHATDNMRLVGT